MTKQKIARAFAWVGAIAFGALVIWWLRPEPVEGHYGGWSLLPALITISVCFLTRNVIVALVLGIFTGGLIIGRINVLDAFMIPSIATENYAQILVVYLWALGGLLGLWNRNGGARHFSETMARKFVNSRNSAKMFAWSLGLLFHQGGTISTVLAGTTVRPISDKHRVAHEELAYVVDSTASPIATVIPFNVWPIYVVGLLMIEPLAGAIPDQDAAMALFLQAIPFNFYAWIAVMMTLLFSLDRLPLLGTPMQAAVARVRETGALDRDGAMPVMSKELTESNLLEGYQPWMADFLAPIGTLMGFCIIPWLAGGSPMVFEGFGAAVVVAVLVSLARGMSVMDSVEAMVSGIKGVTIGAVILGLALSLATASEQLGTSGFVVAATADSLSGVPYILPALLMLLCMIIAFSIGSSWGTYAVVFPIALPLALSLSGDPTFLLLNFGAIMGGAVFGDQCSPISDTTILSSLSCGSDLMDHVSTQLPLALVAAGISSALYVVLAMIVV